MAEMVLFPLINRLIFLLTQEAKLLGGIHEEVADIKNESIFLINMSHGHGSPVREETSPYFSPSLVESIFPSPMLSHSDSESPLFFPDNKSPKFSHSNSIGLLFPSARSETTDSSQNDEEIIQNPSVPSFSHLFPPSGTTSDSETASSICDYGPTTLSISLLFPANKSETENENETEAEPETSSLSFIGSTPNLSHYMTQFYLSHSIMQFFPPARSPSQTDSSENYEIIPIDSHGYVCNGTPPAPAPIPKFSHSNSIELFFPPAKTWVHQVRDVAFRIDVAIDQYLLHMAQHNPHRRGFTGFVHKTTHYLKTLKPRHKIAYEIQKIKASILKIKERTERYHFKSIVHGLSSRAPNVRWQDPRKASLYLDDTDIVEIELLKKQRRRKNREKAREKTREKSSNC